MNDQDEKLALFQGKRIRRTWHNNEWYYSIVDITAVLTDQQDYLKARKYWNKLSERLRSEVVTNCHRLKLPALDGKIRSTDCANTNFLQQNQTKKHINPQND